MRLARIPQSVEDAARRLRGLDTRRETNSTGLPVAMSGGYGATARTLAHNDMRLLVDAVLGKPDASALFGDGDAA